MNAASSQEAGTQQDPSTATDLDPSDQPAQFDPAVAHPARVYAYWLGGKDHYPADRDAAQAVVDARPEVVAGARANRAFGQRVTGYAAAGLRIRQFLDIGAGLPAPGATHEVAQKVSPACRVVYVDNDPLVQAHGRALLTSLPGSESCLCLSGDLREPADLLEAVGAVLDFTRPVAVLLLAVLHFLRESDDPAGIIAQLAAALAPGSLIAISHLTADYAPQQVADGAAAYNARVPVQVYPRTRDQLAAMCAALPVQHPGIVPVNHWLPSLRESIGPPADLYAAVLRQPVPARISSTRQAALIGRPGPTPQDQAAELEQAAGRHPAYAITTDLTSGRLRYVAQARSLSTRPYLVIAATLNEVTAELSSAPA